MQSYLKYKDYYNPKAKAAPLKEKTIALFYSLKRTAKHQKFRLEIYRWIGPYIVQEKLSNCNYNYIVRRLITNKTQILHRIRLKKLVSNTPLEDDYSSEKLQPDEEIGIPQDD